MTPAGRVTKRIGPTVDLLICVVFVVCPILASTNAEKTEHGNTYAKKTFDDSRLSKSSKESKVSTRRSQNDHLLPKSETQLTKPSNDNSALSRFLEDVLRAQDDLKWIDQAVRGINPGKDWEKPSSSRVSKNSESSHKQKIFSSTNADRDNKPRDKRAFDENYEEMWTNKKKYENKDSSAVPERVYLDSELPFKSDVDSSNFDDLNGRESPSTQKNKLSIPAYEKGTADDQIPKDWTKTEDICSLSDWLNSNKEPETEHEKRGDRWIRNFEASQRDQPSEDEKVQSRYYVRSQRDEEKKDEPLTLESLKETVLKLKKSLTEADKKEHENSKNVEAARAKEERKERISREKKKHQNEEQDDEESNWWEAPRSESFDLKKREEASQDLDKNTPLKVWRTKRTEEVNNDDGNLKLFHRAGFGEPYLEERALKELHDRKRRSKGIPPDEKRYSNEPLDKNNLESDEKSADKVSKGLSPCDMDDSSKNEFPSNDMHGKGSNDIEQSDPPRTDSKIMENKLTQDERKGENPGTNSLQTFESIKDELKPVFAKTSNNLRADEGDVARESSTKETEENQDDARQLIKVVEPQPRLYQTDERTKEVQSIGPDEKDCRKVPQQLSEEKRSAQEPGNINILLKSENKNLIKLSNAGDKERSPQNGQHPFVMNRFDVKKKLIVENEEKPGKSVSTIVKMKIEKAQIDTGANANEKRESVHEGDAAAIFDLKKNKPNEELYKDTPELTSDLKQRNVDEERLKNSMEFDKGSTQSGDNEGGRNWYEGVVRNQMGMNIDQSGAEKYKEEGEKDKFKNEEERFREDKKKGESTKDSNDGAASNADQNPPSVHDRENERNRKKYSEVFIMNDGVADRKLADGYVQRKILQYVEYSNDDVEDADLNYGDKEEEENQQQSGPARSNVVTKRKERSNGKGNPVKAKLNVMIKNKIDKKEKKTRRKRRDPDVIEYYEYNSDMDQGDRDAISAARDEEQVQANREENAVGPDSAESQKGTQACPPFKKNENEEEMLKQEREKEKLNKGPQEQFILTLGKTRPKNVTGKAGKLSEDSSRLSSKVTLDEEEGPTIGDQQPGRLDQGEDNANSINRGRLNQLEGEKFPVANGVKSTAGENSEKCILNKDLDSEMFDDFLEDIQLLDQQHGKVAQDVEPLYEELKKLYDWSDSDWKSKPRIKGDQRMSYNVDDKVDSMNAVDESFKDQVESPEIPSQSESSDSSPNLLPLLLAQGGQADAGVAEKLNPTVSSERLESPSASNVSQSNYFALKSTDDMFKGGSEQSNSTEEKLRGASSIGTAVQRPTQKVNGVRNDATAEKYPASWSLTNRRQYVDTDSRSPYENRKYLESQLPREHIQNTERQKRMVISSRDLHESFVEPLDWIDDYDKDIRVRLSRGLKTIEDMSSNLVTDISLYTTSNVTKSEVHEGEGSSTSTSEKTFTEAAEATSKSGSLGLDSVEPPSPTAHNLVETNSLRVRRNVDDPYQTFYDDMDEHQRNLEKMDYGRYSKNTEAMDNRYQLLNSYEDVDDIRNRFSKSNTKIKTEDSAEDEDEDSDYKKVVRSASPKARKRKKKKKRYRLKLKNHKRKDHEDKSKYSDTSHRKRRHHKKHLDSKAKSHEHDQKNKKRASKSGTHHTSVKKSKTTHQNVEKAHEAHDELAVRKGKAAREKMEKGDTVNPDDDFHSKRISMLLAADNIEDESQMDSALHGELAGRIVDHIFEQVQSKEDLKVSLGSGLYQRHKTRSTVAANKRYRQVANDNDMKRTEELLKRIMLLLNRLISEEVQRKTCVSLSPDLVEFLNWMLGIDSQDYSMDQIPSLPLVHPESPPDLFPRDKFLFQGFPNLEIGTDIVELRKKLRLIESLIREYGTLSEKEKTKVQSVHDYLAKQLDLLLEYIDAKEEAGKRGKSPSSIGQSTASQGRILQYQTGMNNATNESYLGGSNNFSSLINVPNFYELSNPNFFEGGGYFHDNSIDYRNKRHRAARSLDSQTKQHKKHRKRRKRKRKHRKHHKGANVIDQSQHKDTVHKATSRHKRGYLDKEFWDFLDSGYEEPLIYSSMDQINAKSSTNNDKEKNQFGDMDEKKPSYGKDVSTKGVYQSYLMKRNGEINEDKNSGLSRPSNTLQEKASASRSTNSAASITKATELAPNLGRGNSFNQNDNDLAMEEEEPITGKNRLEDEVILLNKRQAWKKENEEQLEEVAFGEDMRKGMKDKELFEQLTDMDKKKDALDSSKRGKRKDEAIESDVPLISSSTRQGSDLKAERGQSYSFNDCAGSDRNNSFNLSSEDKLRMLEAKINVYAYNDNDARRIR